MDLEFWNYWTAPGASRRSYLFGPNSEQFRDAGYWPETAPPAFNQLGGDVPEGFQLSITHTSTPGSAVFYTVDGTDPRDFANKFMPYFWYSELESNVEVGQFVLFGMVPFAKRVALTY